VKTGAFYSNGRCEFVLWAPEKNRIQLRIVSPEKRVLEMSAAGGGYWTAVGEEIKPGFRYLYAIDGREERPDPCSFYQPEGVHAASCVVDHTAFMWKDAGFKQAALKDAVIYEMHCGAFTNEGTFYSAESRLEALKELGVTHVEIMPVAAFPGKRNWGYDGVYPYAVQESYGGPEALKYFVNACHQRGLAVILDVVYNHLGPEGNYTSRFAPYFTPRYNTPWGWAFNYDSENCGGVREFVINNAIYWLEMFHIDALRLDAVHAIFDNGAKHILAEMNEKVSSFNARKNRDCLLIAESDLNDVRIVNPPEKGGFGLAAQWADDFHHSVHTALTQERHGYYMDFEGAADAARVLGTPFLYDWKYSAARKRMHGSDASEIDPGKFIVCSQNHDQVGNRMLGERLITLAGFEAAKLAAAFTILSPYVPLIFMGEEYGEEAPFLYFTDHSDRQLAENVRKGRKAEFKAFVSSGEPPDPQAVETFTRSIAKGAEKYGKKSVAMSRFYRKIIGLRAAGFKLERKKAFEDAGLVTAGLMNGGIAFFNFSHEDRVVKACAEHCGLVRIIDSSETEWMGPGSGCPAKIGEDTEIRVNAKSAVLLAGGGK